MSATWRRAAVSGLTWVLVGLVYVLLHRLFHWHTAYVVPTVLLVGLTAVLVYGVIGTLRARRPRLRP